MSERRYVSLDEVVEEIVDRRGVTPTKLGSDFKQAGHRVISAKTIKGRRVDLMSDEPRFIDDETYGRWMKTPLEAGDVILTSEAPLGEPAYISEPVDWVLGQRLFGIRCRSDILLGRYLYYSLQTSPLRDDILSRATGSVAQGIRQSELRKAKLALPSLREQSAITRILGSLDDKLEVNRLMSEALVEMARALFKSWFVDFGPVRAKAKTQRTGFSAEVENLFPSGFSNSELGEIPEGWSVRSIGDLADVVGGSTPSTKEPTFWNEGTHCWATPKDLSELRVPVLLDTERRITDAGLSQIGSGLLPVGTVLLSSRAPIGYLAIAETPVAINQGFIAMKPKQSVSNLFLLFWAGFYHEEIVSRANGSTFLEISKASFRPIPVISPDAPVMAAFEDAIRPLLRRIVTAAHESRMLTELRDRLMPKLISGELSIAGGEDR